MAASNHGKASCQRQRRSVRPRVEFEQELISVISDAKRTDSLAFILSEVSRVGNNVRERLSADMMILIGQLRTSLDPDRGIRRFLTTRQRSPAAWNCSRHSQEWSAKISIVVWAGCS